MAVFQKQSERDFEERMIRYIADGFPHWFAEIGEDGAREYIRSAIASGALLGLVSNMAVGLFITLKLEFGETFERSPEREWAREMLRRPNLPGDTRMVEVAKRLISGTNGNRIVAQPAASITGQTKFTEDNDHA